MHSTALLGWFGAALSIALPWPQVWRSVARGRTKGLSATACWQGTAMPIGWITYGLLSGEKVQVVTNTVTGVAGLAVLVTVLVKQSELRTGRQLLISAAGAAAVLAAAAGSVAAALLSGIGGARAAAFLGAVLAISAILGAIPQPVSLLRDRRQDLAGLSPLRWWLAAAACGSWCTYGLTTGQVAVWLSALVGLGSALIVCWVLVADRRATTTTVSAAPAIRPAHASARVIHPAVATVSVVRPAASAAARVVRSASSTARPVYGTARATGLADAVHATTQANRPVDATRADHGTTRAMRPADTARAVHGTARATRPGDSRPARGVARVPRSDARATLIMSREFAPA